MKRYLLIAIISAACPPLLLHAQKATTEHTTPQKRFSWSIETGYNHIIHPSDYSLQSNHLDGVHTGLSVGYSFKNAPCLHLSLGIGYQYGYGHSNYRPVADVRQTTIHQHGLTLPLRLAYHYEFNKDWGIFAFTGPQFSWYWNRSHFNGSAADTEHPYTNYFNIAWSIGAGVHYRNWYLAVSYDISLYNRIFHAQPAMHPKKLPTQIWNVSIGYLF